MNSLLKYTLILIAIVVTAASDYLVWADTSSSSTQAMALEESISKDEKKLASPNAYDVHNPNSIKPIPEPHIWLRRRIWREIYLKERKNRPFFTRDQEITKFIIEGVKEGSLKPYTNDSFTEEMTEEQFLENLRDVNNESASDIDQEIANSSNDAGWGTQHTTRSTSQDHNDGGIYFLPNEVTTLELMEDLIFDKVSSTFVRDIQSITLIIPEHKFVTGLRKIVATFKYKDLVPYLDSQLDAIWFNVKNNAGNMKMTEAIALRKFDSRIVKMDNPTDATVEDIYPKTPQKPKANLQASKDLEEELIELDWFLWEN